MAEKDLPFIRNLASSDRHVRTEALSALQHFLSARPAPLSPADALKLWTGLFYALWMADRPLTQQRLCDALADLLFVLPAHDYHHHQQQQQQLQQQQQGQAEDDDAVVYLRAFWATMAREWPRIDVYRLEKFMLLVRRVLGASLRWMRRGGERDGAAAAASDTDGRSWDAGRVDTMVGLLGSWPLAVGDEPDLSAFVSRDGGDVSGVAGLLPKTIHVGLKLHVMDIWVDEAEKVGLVVSDPEDEGYAILERLNGLVDKLAAETTSTAVRIRTKEALADERLPWNSKGGEEADGGEWDGFED